MAPAAAAPRVSLAAAVLLSLLLHAAHGGGGGKQKVEHVPVRRVVYRAAAATMGDSSSSSSPAYEPFELCMGCRCCAAAANASSCVDTSCCYAINCNVPGKPFGVCAFSPHTCGCGHSGNCTTTPQD